MSCRIPLSVVLVTVNILACSSKEPDAEPVVEASRECSPAFGSEVCNWSQTQGAAVVAVGTDVPMAFIENSPAEAAAGPPAPAVVVAFPEAALTQAGLSETSVYWEPHGHPPGAFLVPHFDFHFYLTGGMPHNTIDCTNLTKPEALPAGYMLPDMELPPEMAAEMGTNVMVGACVPQMGMHSLPSVDMESSEPFRGTMVVGYYNGKPLFMEPMISKAMLMERASFELPIPYIPGLAGVHPRKFNAEYNADSDSYRFVFTDFAGS